jgi:hypothetical protein
MINKRDQYAILKFAREDGKEEGVAIGEARGMEDERSYIKNLLKQGLSGEELLKRIEC